MDDRIVHSTTTSNSNNNNNSNNDNGNYNNNNNSNNNNRNKSNSNKNNSNNNLVVIIEIRMEILQGASLRMGSLHHIKVTESDIEGGTIIIIYKNTICDCILALSTWPYPMSSPWGEYCIPHLSNAYHASPYDPHSCTKSCKWSRRRPSEQLPSSRRLESQPPRLKEWMLLV